MSMTLPLNENLHRMQVPPLPHRREGSLRCPWCRSGQNCHRKEDPPLHDMGELPRQKTCPCCHKGFEYCYCLEAGVFMVWGIRSETDIRLMNALGIEEKDYSNGDRNS